MFSSSEGADLECPSTILQNMETNCPRGPDIIAFLIIPDDYVIKNAVFYVNDSDRDYYVAYEPRGRWSSPLRNLVNI